MAYTFNLPDVGEGMAEGEISSWLVKVGDVVQEGDAILELQNDKLLQEIPSPVSGTVTKILVEPGTVSLVGDPLIEFDGGAGETTVEVTSDDHSVVAEAPIESPTQSKVQQEPIAAKESNNKFGSILAMPSVRMYAFENNIDLQEVVGTGKHGHITRDDVTNSLGDHVKVQTEETQTTAALSQNKVESAITTQSVGNTTREKLTPMRKAIAKAMVTSKQSAPHVTLFDEVVVDELVNQRNEYKTFAAEQGVKLTFLPYIIKALVLVAKKYPILQSSMDEETQEIVYHGNANIGIAADTERGLIVPNIKNADTQSIFSIAREITRLSTAASDGSIQATDIQGGTITISNIGSIGGGWFTPIINYPEVAILGVGKISKEPVVDSENNVVAANVMKLSLSFDHRLIDGATAQLAMNELKHLLANPAILILS